MPRICILGIILASALVPPSVGQTPQTTPQQPSSGTAPQVQPGQTPPAIERSVPVAQSGPKKKSKKDKSKNKFTLCPAKFDDDPQVNGIYKVGGDVLPPKATHMEEASFSDQARRDKFQGITLIAFVVGVDGLPKDICVQRPIGHGLDEQAVSAVKEYRFKPAAKGTVPVPVRLTVEVSFRLY